jgi:Carboxylesterase family
MRDLRHYAAAVLYLASATTAWKVGEVVKTSSGEILGHAASRNHDVSEYLGIPYAVPPVGPLRFMPPREFKGKALVKADRFVRIHTPVVL